MTGFQIGKKHVGDGAPCLIVGEVAQAHEGSLMLAHSYIDAIAKAGADAVKFQLRLPEVECAPDEPWRVAPEWPQDASRFDYWKRVSFNQEQLWSLAAHAQAKGLLFLCSVFSPAGVALLDKILPAWKVASGEIRNEDLFDALWKSGKPVIVSTGMANWDEIVTAASFPQVALLQCTSEYPCPPEHVGLNVLDELRERFSCPVGLSDHSGTVYAGLAAVARGCDILETHVTLSREAWGFDVSSSITTSELRMLVDGIRFIEKAKAPLNKDFEAERLAPMRHLFMEQSRRKAEHDAQRTAQV